MRSFCPGHGEGIGKHFPGAFPPQVCSDAQYWSLAQGIPPHTGPPLLELAEELLVFGCPPKPELELVEPPELAEVEDELLELELEPPAPCGVPLLPRLQS